MQPVQGRGPGRSVPLEPLKGRVGVSGKGGLSGPAIFREMNGVLCQELELEPPVRQGIAVTRSFGRPITAMSATDEAPERLITSCASDRRRGMSVKKGAISAWMPASA